MKEEFDGEKKEIDKSHNSERQELKDMIETIRESEEAKLEEV